MNTLQIILYGNFNYYIVSYTISKENGFMRMCFLTLGGMLITKQFLI